MSSKIDTPALLFDAHALYELTVQSPRALVPFLRQLHGGSPRVLHEDFAGTAAIAREWLAKVESSQAVAIDWDAKTLARAALTRGLKCVQADLRRELHNLGCAADIVFAGNFSIGELHTRSELLTYLRQVHARLAPGGMFACDTYGGASAFREGAVERHHIAPDGALIRYTWEQREADPTTARVVNALHFRVLRGGDVVQELTDAFVYRWRLWSVPELRDALAEVGFQSTEVHSELAPRAVPAALDESFIVCVVARRNKEVS